MATASKKTTPKKAKAPKAEAAPVALKGATAELVGYGQAPRKVRLVTDLVKGKRLPEAFAALSFLPKRAALPIKKLLESAAANAAAKGDDIAQLRVTNITVDNGGMIVRFMPRAMGRATPIRRRRSLVRVTLAA